MSFDMTQSQRAWPALGLPDDFDMDQFLVTSDLRVLGKHEQVRIDQARAQCASLEALGLHPLVIEGPTPGFAVIYFSKEPSVLTEARELEAKQRLRNNSALRAKASTRLGALLGYAPCCVEHFVSGPQDDELAMSRLGLEVEHSVPSLLNFFPRNLAPLGFLPCSPRCVQAQAWAQRVQAQLCAEFGLEPQQVSQALASLVIWMRGPIFAVLPSAQRLGPRRFAYGGVQSAVEHADFPDLPQFRAQVANLREALSLLRRGDQVQVRADGALLVERQGPPPSAIGTSAAIFAGRVVHYQA